MNQARILIVDDDRTIHDALTPVLEDEGYGTLHARDAGEGIRLDLQEHPDLTILDLQMPRVDGLETLSRLHAQSPGTPVVMLTAHGTFASAVAAVKGGAFDFVGKPFDNDHLLLVIHKALEHRRMSDELHELRRNARMSSGIGRILGQSPAMNALREKIRKAAGTAATVLLEGESGSGKELTARALHAESPRLMGPFIAVNCAAIPQELAESELFGHEKGAFTGASEARTGCFEAADRGTIFLDEVGELPHPVQAKLLRVLQEKEVIRLGRTTAVSLDVRVIAATNRDLRSLVGEGRFREDLYYRLSVLPLRIPPLREHREDIPLYAADILARARETLSVRVEEISEGALRRLESHDWRGNFRELSNVLQRSLLFARGSVLREDDLDFGSGGPHAYDPALGLEQYVRQVSAEAERRTIQEALKTFGSNRSQAAEYLKIGRTTLYRKLRDLGLEDR